ncbi:MAG TPA: hypothetical protein VFD70_23320 [Anaerolineae bacterium]|nr:hypothetical protein [Anaerolineae bacterium]
MEIVAFFVFFGVMLFLQHWLQQHIQGLTFAVTGNPGCAVRVLFILLLPGVLLHEASHWAVANVLGVKTGPINIGLGKMRGNKHFSLGSVTVERTDPLRESLIGVAPFVSGIMAIWLLMGYGFDLWSVSDPAIVWERIYSTLGDPLTWVALYLVFAVSTSMIPSASDREPWGVIIVLFGAVGALALVLGWTPNFSPNLIETARKVLDALTLVFGTIVVVNGALAVVIFLLEWGFGAMTQRRVRY